MIFSSRCLFLFQTLYFQANKSSRSAVIPTYHSRCVILTVCMFLKGGSCDLSSWLQALLLLTCVIRIGFLRMLILSRTHFSHILRYFSPFLLKIHPFLRSFLPHSPQFQAFFMTIVIFHCGHMSLKDLTFLNRS